MTHPIEGDVSYEDTTGENGKRGVLRAGNGVWHTGAPVGGSALRGTGPEAIFAGVFKRLATEWVGYRAVVHTYLVDGDRVAAFGGYAGTYAKTGKSMRASFAHLYRLRDGKIVSMEQVVDSAMVLQAMVPALQAD
ncbi:nuclear transport factor 2 family protein [Acidovorax sp. SUPP3334]|uniref:nuclear transport factor 2 family protein n=1 Tax=Acidovorax sp. SUPP3334 TaxID=2920881 RepID=UPI0023DE6726|nr:nuclear transport factor 2 family protein [Acidovorax sp. SUPP3334]GKT22442.1 nuclear transport factor 2 family protein [Acidovorax sp. SUPP3334]